MKKENQFILGSITGILITILLVYIVYHSEYIKDKPINTAYDVLITNDTCILLKQTDSGEVIQEVPLNQLQTFIKTDNK